MFDTDGSGEIDSKELKASLFSIRSSMGVEPKIGVFYPPNHPFVHRVFHYFPPSILGYPYFWNVLLVLDVNGLTNPYKLVGCKSCKWVIIQPTY